MKIFLLILFLTPVVTAYVWPGIAILPSSSCLFRNIFGVDCPTCGLTRGFVSASRGNFYHAFLLNPLAPLLLFAFLLLSIVLTRDILLRQALADKVYSHFAPYIGITLACMVLVSLAVKLVLKW